MSLADVSTLDELALDYPCELSSSVRNNGSIFGSVSLAQFPEVLACFRSNVIEELYQDLFWLILSGVDVHLNV